ncbi:MAG: thiouridylase [Clostridiaceae bacterium BRH_c20a]|nr:MAG: thiouridylase [Clostridiaceae bacterium BRH_c20a]KJS21153.1 MAG: thiouridylase [Clostridiaceae bacterium BRH_c20a]
MSSKGTVVVGMSGGVDSSVAAYLLKEQGYDVIGVTMQIWPVEHDEERVGGCCSLSAVNDARRVADKLGIPFYVMNFRDLFEIEVIDYFTNEYLQGRTPNPCIACNKKIKFEGFLTKAKQLGADYIATGHYAKLLYDNTKKRFVLKKAVDTMKDQTYALYNFTQEQMAHTLLPLGNYAKPQIREIAASIELRVANKPDSQEICFVTDNNYKNFIENRVGQEHFRPGPFLDTQGNWIGTHEGLPNYTIGQRKGLGLALGYPVYVVKIDVEKNAVIIGKDNEVFQGKLIACQNNYILFEDLHDEIQVEAKIRYSAKPAKAILKPLNKEEVLVEFVEAQRAITPGQAVVYYQGDYVVGGGTIVKGI